MNARPLVYASLIACAPLTAQAIPITWDFEGITNGWGLPGGTCQSVVCQDILRDVTFTGRIIFDSDATDTSPDDPFWGSYLSTGAPYGISLDIGSYRAEWDAFRVDIRPDPSSLPLYGIRAKGFDFSGLFSRIGLFQCYEIGRAHV